MKKMTSVQYLTRTAMLLALAVVFQNLRLLIGVSPISQLVIGSLVNLCLIVAAGSVGIGSALVICIATPLFAFAQGQLPHPLFAPVTMVGNMTIALVFYYILKSRLMNVSDFIGVILGAFAKWGVMYFLGIQLVLNTLIPAGTLPAPKVQMISVAFNINQLLTALMGGIVAVIVLRVLSATQSYHS